MRTCPVCDAQLPIVARSDARFCSSRCRVRAHRARRHEPPADLVALPRWIRRTASKVPVSIDGGPASSTNAATWSTYAEAAASTMGEGLGFVLNGDGIVCVDLDHVLDDGGVPAAWAVELLGRMPATYVEISPSGDGLHVWGRATVGRGRCVDLGGGRVEVYGTGRYMTVTARRFAGSVDRLGDLSEVVAEIIG